jgi:NAD(P)-dependent dehydrogenase (short-subunit alcohol dehydrogenase family)
MELERRAAIVTGGAMGIGRAVVECLLREGASVLLVDINDDAGRATAAALAQPPARLAFWRADIAKAGDAAAAVAAAVAQFGGVDILVNNAGIQAYGGPADTTEEVWDRVMAVNLKGQWLMSKYAIPEMLKRGKGAIVNVASVQGLASPRNSVAYSTSKHGMIGLTRTMAVDLAAQGVRVNCVCPGTVDTPLVRWVINQDADPAKLEKVLNQMHPIGRIAQPKEIAEVVVFLAGDRASFMTGSIVTVDGGLLVPIPGTPNQE